MYQQQKWFKIALKDQSELRTIKELAANRGVTMSDLVRILIEQERQRQEAEGLLDAQPSLFGW